MNTQLETTQTEEAVRLVSEAIAEFGKPVWVANVPKAVRDRVPTETLRELLANARPSEGWRTARDGVSDISAWAKENVFEIVTIKQLAEIGEVSEATVRKLVTDRPDIFKKIESRKYEIRDPQEDRKADK
jgi:hypothetical protein